MWPSGPVRLAAWPGRRPVSHSVAPRSVVIPLPVLQVDLCQYFFSYRADKPLAFITFGVFIVFCFETSLNFILKLDYGANDGFRKFSFYFWLDFIGKPRPAKLHSQLLWLWLWRCLWLCCWLCLCLCLWRSRAIA